MNIFKFDKIRTKSIHQKYNAEFLLFVIFYDLFFIIHINLV